MSNYVYGSSLSYDDYLQAKSFEDGIRYEIEGATRSAIASNEELQREHIATTAAIADAVSSGFEQLSFDMQSISAGITELTAVFHWGLSELLSGVGHINDSLEELVRVSKTPAQTWAYEQFEIARDAYRQGLYDDALEYLNRSIDGHGDNTGYRLEYRFHFLLGTIRIGSFQNSSTSIVDLIEAEKAFLAAAKYARHDQPNEAGRAFLAGGWSAYCQGKISKAEEYTQQAISLYPELGEGHFQLAKILMHRGVPDEAMVPLRAAIELDRIYTLKAGSDDDFKAYDEHVYGLVTQMRTEAMDTCKKALVVLEKQKTQIEKAHVQEFSCRKYVDLKPLRKSFSDAKKAANNNTYFGYLDALSCCRKSQTMGRQVRREFMSSAIRDVESKISSIKSKCSDVEKSSMRITWGLVIAVGIFASFALAVHRGHSFGSWVGYLFWGTFISIMIGNTANAAQKRAEVSGLQKEKSRLGRIKGELQAQLEKVQSKIDESKQASKGALAAGDDVIIGKVYEVEVSGIKEFGAFVTVLPGREGLIHISEISNVRVNSVSDILSEGDIVKAKVLSVDERGRIRLSRKQVESTD